MDLLIRPHCRRVRGWRVSRQRQAEFASESRGVRVLRVQVPLRDRSLGRVPDLGVSSEFWGAGVPALARAPRWCCRAARSARPHVARVGGAAAARRGLHQPPDRRDALISRGTASHHVSSLSPSWGSRAGSRSPVWPTDWASPRTPPRRYRSLPHPTMGHLTDGGCTPLSYVRLQVLITRRQQHEWIIRPMSLVVAPAIVAVAVLAACGGDHPGEATGTASEGADASARAGSRAHAEQSCSATVLAVDHRGGVRPDVWHTDT
jgi:hypothetical protein